MSYLVVGGMSGLGAVAARTASQIAAQAKSSKAKPKSDDDDGATATQVIGIASQVAQGYNAYQAERRAELEAQRPVYVPQPKASEIPSWAPWAAAGAAVFIALFAVASSRR